MQQAIPSKRLRMLPCSISIPAHVMKAVHRRTVPPAGFAAAWDDIRFVGAYFAEFCAIVDAGNSSPRKLRGSFDPSLKFADFISGIAVNGFE